MKRLAIVTFVLLTLAILPINAFALDLAEKGIKAGMTYSKVSGDDVEDAGSKLGIGGGGYLNFTLNKDFCLQPELLYTMKGSRSETDLGESTYSLDYIELPILATYALPDQGSWTPMLHAGPYMGFNVRANSSTETDGRSNDTDLKSETQTLDYGFILGAGVVVQRFHIDARFAMGLASTYDPAEGDAPDINNRVFSMLVDYSF